MGRRLAGDLTEATSGNGSSPPPRKAGLYSKNETPFLADKFNEMKKEYRNEFLSRLGIMTANTMKRERVQTAEVNAGMGEAVDLIYTVIDFWNKQAESYGLEKYKMTYNGVSEAITNPKTCRTTLTVSPKTKTKTRTVKNNDKLAKHFIKF